jgi:LacI family transcriptional regulator
MPTIRDVAKLAGVSTMTVSRVVNNSGYVSEVTRLKVETAVNELGYVPNMLGPSLRFKQTNTLALVLTDVTNPFWTTIARGVEDAAQKQGYSIILCNTDESNEKQDQYLTMLLKRRIDGILLVPTRSSAEDVRRIQQQGIATVVLDRHVTNADVDIVRGDSVSGAYQVVNHLLSLGHRRIGMLAGPNDVSTSTDRVMGYHQALREAGLGIQDEHISWGHFTHASGYEMAKEMLTAVPSLTAIFAANNFIGTGAVHAAKELGLCIPEDLSIAAFGDIPSHINPNPFLTVATHPTYEMGYQAAQLLMARIAGEGPAEFQEIILPTKIVVRQSTAQPSKS